ncbi:glycosyltransferase family 9 protein [Sinomicrobium kalidii]|uniref:glycosyltransferase family 9 protein n=1 Tax=Sinomicrobium kalidii TaxID=2900738 RepID=UPI001E62B836|nr:glycosyltransferase family 9 protein [Sinomicrobium kalidii]UGU17842.1 glycosyltransferase family 9 protein [Sinomicrobium kalidii]
MEREKNDIHLLVIRLSAMGDVAMTVPVLHALAKQHPGVRVTVLSRAFFKPVFDRIPGVSFYEADIRGRHKGVRGLYKLYRELKALDIDAVADLHNVLRSNILKAFFRTGGFPVVQIDKGRREKKALTRARGKIFRQLKSTHQRYADVFTRLGYPVDLSVPVFSPGLELSPELWRSLGRENRLEKGEKWIGIAPFAAFKGKMYPADLMEEVLEKLDREGKYTLLLFGGGKEEEELLDALQSKYKSAVNVAGKLSFRQELRLISNLDLMVAMDSGNAHLAAMYGIKTVTLWGVTHPYAGFYPFGQDKKYALLADRKKYPLVPTSVYGKKLPEGYEDVMRSVSPEKVVKKIRKVLADG